MLCRARRGTSPAWAAVVYRKPRPAGAQACPWHVKCIDALLAFQNTALLFLVPSAGGGVWQGVCACPGGGVGWVVLVRGVPTCTRGPPAAAHRGCM